MRESISARASARGARARVRDDDDDDVHDDDVRDDGRGAGTRTREVVPSRGDVRGNRA